jgi:hypothetical protein
MNPSIDALTQAKDKAEKNLELLEGELLIVQNAVKNLTADIMHYKDSIDKLTPVEPINHWVGPPKPKEMKYQIGDVFMPLTSPIVAIIGGPTYEERKHGNS